MCAAVETSTSPTLRPRRRSVLIIVAVLIAAIAAAVVYYVRSDDDAAPQRVEIRHYVALGDSFSAAPFVPEADLAGGCFRSSNNYPNVIARALVEASFVDVTCSGADTTAMTASSRTQLFLQVPAQLDALTADTDLVTVGIGGNDFELFSTLTEKCPSLRAGDPKGAPCAAALGDTPSTQIPQIVERVDAVLGQIAERSPRARIVLVGYPDVVPDDDTCDELPLADGDYAFVDRINRELNDALREAAARAKVSFIDVWTASQGHDICAKDPWVNGQYTSRNAFAYHPFAVEQEAVAKLILATLDQP